jgi:hypothetical protein
MPFQILVKVREATQDEIYSPEMEKQEAERQISVIKETLGKGFSPDVPWIAVRGQDILSASIIETSY